MKKSGSFGLNILIQAGSETVSAAAASASGETASAAAASAASSGSPDRAVNLGSIGETGLRISEYEVYLRGVDDLMIAGLSGHCDKPQDEVVDQQSENERQERGADIPHRLGDLSAPKEHQFLGKAGG